MKQPDAWLFIVGIECGVVVEELVAIDADVRIVGNRRRELGV